MDTEGGGYFPENKRKHVKEDQETGTVWYADFRAEAVRAVQEGGNRTVREVAEALGVAEALLHSRKARGGAPPADIRQR